MKSSIKFIVICSLMLLGMHVVQAMACTGMRVVSSDAEKERAVTFARTLEFGTPSEAGFLFAPAKKDWVSSGPDGSDGLTWTNQYAFMGPNAFGEKMVIDGINEKGLYIGAFWFARIAKYQTVPETDTAKAIAPWLVSAWVLGNCASLDEVAQKIREIKIVDVVFEKLQSSLPMHWIVMDNTGKCLVIEPINGEIVISDNPVGVFTNAPSLPWHLQNLSNYMNLSPDYLKEATVNGYPVYPAGEGAGMLGLPGDFTPPSRFVRAALLTNAAEKESGIENTINLAFLLISNISIAKGVVRTVESDGTDASDYTQWTGVYDFNRLRFYFKTYNNQNISMVDFNTLKSQHTDFAQMDIYTVKPAYTDVTGQME
ncbi:MAG: choloylglycine hydrolase family protein [Desulfovibrionales bacterium]|nr:choloylglycine hydrolase family protein [Desulfovibrionales bacterium]